MTLAPPVRRAKEEDLAAVVEIESQSFEQPWSRETFASLLARPSVDILVADAPDPAQVANAVGGPDARAAGGAVAGYVVLRSTGGESELANLAVSPRHRGKGVARALLTQAVETAQGRGATWMFLAVRASNREAARLYERFGFQEIGAHGSYYDDPPEDARVFAMEFESASSAH